MASVVGVLARICDWLLRLVFDLAVFTRRDCNIGPILCKAAPKELQALFCGKHVLVVGGTKGIGSGIAVALAEAGAHVHIVGRDEAAAGRVLDMMRSASSSSGKSSPEGAFQFHRADLGSVQGCMQFVRKMTEAKSCRSSGGSPIKFDAVVMTLGAWPDWRHPHTKDGYNKVLFLDVIARFIVFNQLSEKNMLADKAMIMSVLASGQELPLATFSKSYMKNSIVKSGGKQGVDYVFLRTLLSAGASGDAFLRMASKQHPNYKFIGTFPGLVATDVMIPTFGSRVADLAKLMLQKLEALNVSMSEYDCGVNHLNILARVAEHDVPLSYWDHFLNARNAGCLASDAEFGDWVWKLCIGSLGT